MSSLSSTIESLAQQFAAQVLTIIRQASLEDILGHTGTTRAPKAAKAAREPKATKAAKTAKAPRAAKAPKAPRRRGRLGRRTTDQIQTQLASVVALLKKSPDGLRSEAIRGALKLDRREVPRVLGEGLKSKALKKTGAKRATVYRAN